MNDDGSEPWVGRGQGADPVKKFRAFADDYARRQQQQQPPSSSGTSGAAAAAAADEGGDDGGNGLPLPAVVVQRVLRCLDGRSAAAAAAACKQLAAAHRLNTTLDVPASFQVGGRMCVWVCGFATGCMCDSMSCRRQLPPQLLISIVIPLLPRHA